MTFTKRILKNEILAKSDIESYYDAIVIAQKIVDRCFCMIGMQNKFIRQNFYLLNFLLMNLEQINQRTNLKRFLECIDGPIKRMNADLINIKNDLKCKLLNSIPKPQLIKPSIKENKNSTLNVF